MTTLQNIRAQFPLLTRRINHHPLCYLDNAATTFSPRCVIDAMVDYEQRYRGNVLRGVHTLSMEATDAYHVARQRVASYLNAANVDEVIFTGGTTASINLLARALEINIKAGDEIVVSLAEHHSNFVPWQQLCQRTGAVLKAIGLQADGRLASTPTPWIGERCRVVAITHASNVTGAVTELAPIVAAAKAVGALVVVDGAQMAAHGPVDVQQIGADFYAFSGHKCYGPNGVGVLWGRAEALAKLPPFFVGGGVVERVTLERTDFLSTPQRFEAGTPPTAQAIGLGVALDWLRALPEGELRQRQREFTQVLIAGLSAIDGVTIVGPRALDQRLPIVSFVVEGCHPHDICHLLDDYGIALRGGHHCAQPLAAHFGVQASSRASLAVFNQREDVEALLHALPAVLKRLR